MSFIKYNDFVIPETYFNAFLTRYRNKYIADYFSENGTYPSIEDIAKINIPGSELANIKHKCYINYLVIEADKIDGDILVPGIPEDPEEPQIEVTANNISGKWELVEWNGAALTSGTYVFLDMVRNDMTFKIYQNLDNFGNVPHVVSGSYYLETDPELGAIIRGAYDHDSGDWAHRYIIKDLTATKMTWVAKDDPDFVQEYIRVDEIPEEIINSSIPSINQTPTPSTPYSKYGVITESVTVPTNNDYWFELPNMNDDNFEYYTHCFEDNDNIYRNYSFGWSQKDRISKWVAYPLDNGYMNHNVDRTDAWAIDPLLGEEKSSAPFGGYAGDYARGMLIPSASRFCCEIANEQVFYGSNIFPQLNEHNEGIWAVVESHIRDMAHTSDCTYVLKGLITSENSIIEKDSHGNNVTVPDAIYAVILKQYKDSTYGEWNACAFYTEHKEYANRDLTQIIMSVSDLESITGMEYFVALKNIVGEEQYNTIKSTLNTTIFV